MPLLHCSNAGAPLVARSGEEHIPASAARPGPTAKPLVKKEPGAMQSVNLNVGLSFVLAVAFLSALVAAV